MVIGLILLVVAFLLGRENAQLLIGEGIDPQSREEIEKAIREVDGVEDLLELLTMHLSPEDVLVTADVRFRDDLSTEEIARTIDRVEAAIREVAPEATQHLRRAGDPLAGGGDVTSTPCAWPSSPSTTRAPRTPCSACGRTARRSPRATPAPTCACSCSTGRCRAGRR